MEARGGGRGGGGGGRECVASVWFKIDSLCWFIKLLGKRERERERERGGGRVVATLAPPLRQATAGNRPPVKSLPAPKAAVAGPAAVAAAAVATAADEC